MYLLDNKNSLEINELNKIYQIKTKEELINLSENDFSGIDYFFNKYLRRKAIFWKIRNPKQIKATI